MHDNIDIVLHVATLGAIVIGGLWHQARTEARLAVLERLVTLLLGKAGMAKPEGGD